MRNITILTLSLLCILSACKDKKHHTEQMPALHIQVDTPQITNITCMFEYPAYLQSAQQVNLVARVPGYLQQIDYTPGEKVKKGQTLFVIEPQPYKDKLIAAQAAVQQAKAEYDYAQANYQKYQVAVKQNSVSEIDFLQSKSNYFSAQANLENAKAALNSAQINYDYCFVKAPADGVVSVNMFDVGNYVGSQGGSATLATFYADSQLYAYFNMAYSDYYTALNFIKMGNKANVTITDPVIANQAWTGILDYSSPNVDQTTGTVNMRAVVDNTKEELLDGMYVRVHMPYQYVKNAIMIPEASIGTNQAGRYVYVVQKDSVVSLRQLTVGYLDNDGMRQVLDGIKPGEEYVVRALVNMRNGEKVVPYIMPTGTVATEEKTK
ncbi:MAG: efflux RND transporter periplasmic adaptor subunit [Marinifilaceae bacterium]